MRGVARACHRAYAHDGSYPLLALLYVQVLFLFSSAMLFGFEAITVHSGAFLMNCWMLGTLALAYALWSVLCARAAVGPATGYGFVLAAFGLACRYLCEYHLYGIAGISGFVYGGTSLMETLPQSRLRFLVWVHRYVGLLAYVVGLGLVAWTSRRAFSRGRAASGAF